MADWPSAGAAAWDDRHCSGAAEVASKRVGVIAAVGDEAPKPARHRGDQVGRNLHVAGVAGREVDDRRAAEDVGDDVDLGGLPAARDANGLRLRPPLPPWAERCALT